MRPCKKIASLVACLFVWMSVFSQDNLQFIENKGQWEQKVKYRGEISYGIFALQSNGYRVLLHNKEDLDRLGRSLHAPHPDKTVATTAANTSTDLKSPSMLFTDAKTGSDTGVTLRSHIYEMRFLNSNVNPEIIPDKALATYSNYILGNDPAKWQSNCRTFQAVTYKNVYPNIDVRYYTSGGSLKYDFIVHPGGDVASIAMYFDGVESLKIKEGALTVKTSVNEIKELPPYTYQLIDEKRIEIPCSYEVKGNIVRFKLQGTYSTSSTLVIDPTLVFSTFTGSTADNWGYTATYDGQGNFYAGGIVFNNSGTSFPVSNGAFQTKYQGGSNSTGESAGFDMAIMKFDASGANRVYATYLGGTDGNEQPHSMVVDGAGNLVIAGRSTSSDYPMVGALKKYGTPVAGTWHIIVTKLNANGTGLVGSVLIGGNGMDGVNINHKYKMMGAASINRNYGDDARSEVILDAGGNVYFASCTQSTNFPVTAISSQTTTGGTNASGRAQDAVVLKLTPDLSSVLFSVIMGGKDDDAAFVLALNPLNNNIFVAGATASTDFPGNKSTAKFNAYQGGLADGFVAELTNDGGLVRSSYFGTSGNDLIYGIQFDKFGFPYVMGTTTGTWPVVNAAFSQTGGKQFIVKLKPDLSDYVYSTIFGTNAASPNLSPTAFLVDRCQNVYVSGWGGAADVEDSYPNSTTTGMTVTGDAYQKTTDGSDFYFFVLQSGAASQLYGSFFGQNGGFGEHVDGGTSRFDRNGVIYQSLCANCSSPKPKFPTTPGVWAPNNGSKGCNLAAVKIAFNLAGIGAGVEASVNGIVHDTTGCVPVTVVLTDTVAQGKQYIWDYNDGSKMDTTTVPTTTHTYNSIGLYRVMLVAVDSNSCNIADTSFVTMRVRDDKAALSFTSAKIPPCSSLSYQFTNNSTAIKPFQTTSFRWDFGDGTTQLAGTGSVTHTYTAAGTYIVKLILIDTNYCNQPDSATITIRIASNVKAQFNTPSIGCAPYTAILDNTSIGGQSFSWDFGDGSALSTQTSPSHLYASPGTYIIKLIATDTATCNKSDSASLTLNVYDKPSSQFVYSPQPTITNAAVNFQNSSLGGTSYKWLFGDGDTLVTTQSTLPVSHLYNASGTFNACLVVFNNAGCSDTSCQQVAMTVVPVVDVSNAFSPNGDGVNDKIYVRGYGITKMTWRIYNRWGAVVYLGTDINDGWDGRFNGKLQPQEVYHYTLEVEFSSHDKVSKKGDITLLR